MRTGDCARDKTDLNVRHESDFGDKQVILGLLRERSDRSRSSDLLS